MPRAALCRTRIALATLAAAVLAVLAATTFAPGGALANPAGTTHLPGPPDGHPDGRVLRRPGDRRPRVPLHAPRLQRRTGPARDPAAVQRDVGQLPRPAAAVHAQREQRLVAGEPDARRRRVRLPRGARPLPLPARVVRPLRRRLQRQSRSAGHALAEERLLHLRLLHLQLDRHARRRRSPGPRGAAATPPRCAASPSAPPTSTTTAIRVRRSRSTASPTGPTGSAR